MGPLRTVLTSKPFHSWWPCVVIVAAVIVGVEVTKGAPTYPINVVYSSAPGLFTGAAVDVLGVPVGTVTNVQNVGDKVDVALAVDQGTRIPSAAFASLVAPQLLGSPDVDLNPGYTGGPFLGPGATIPQDHTAVPVSTDELLKELQHTLNAINPHAVGNLVTNLATDLDGQGANLNKLIASAAGTVQLLATKGDDLGQLNGTLAQLTGTLDTDTSQIEQLVEQYDTVSTTVAQHSGRSTTPSPNWLERARRWSACSYRIFSRWRRMWERSRPSAVRSIAISPRWTRSCRTATTSSRAPSAPTTRTTTGST